jgi:quinol monooxygenase YgiN
MLIVTGSVTARPETFDALLRAALDHVARSRIEPGCLSHSVHADCEEPLRLFFFEQWADRPALDEHFAQAGSQLFMRTVRELAASGSGVQIFPILERRFPHDRRR